MITAKLYPNIYSRHNSQIYAGLYDLAHSGEIILQVTGKPNVIIKRTKASNVLSLEIIKKGMKKIISFDLHDSYKINSKERLDISNIYFKRSFYQPYIDSLNYVGKKIRPYGLNYECHSKNERNIIKRLAIYYATNRYKNTLKNFFYHLPFEFFRHILLKYDINLLHLKPTTSDDLFVDPNDVSNPIIFFQTRVWTSDECPRLSKENIRNINQMRTNTIRALKSKFGDLFLGGLYNSEYARENFPELITELSTQRVSYLKIMKRSLICVTTKGLHDSIGGRFPEFLNASRCIVTEPMKYQLPVPLTEGKNYLSFKSPEECVSACQYLLDNPQLINSMRHANYHYYINHLKPSKLIYNCLKQAF